MRRVTIAGMIGNGLEWYDFALYGYFAGIIGKLFSPPSDDVYTQMMLAYGVFAAGFIMRPLGGMLFGYLGDKFGRKFSLTLSLLMMAIPTACLGLLPTYASIGVWAPVLLLTVRLLQGLSLGGQFSGSIVFIVEHAPAGKRGFAGSTTIMSLCAGMLLGSLVATVFTEVLSTQSLESWGWRMPFLLSVGIAYIGYYIRHHTEESPHYEKARSEDRLSKTPVKEAFRHHWLPLLRGVGIYMSVTVPFYIITIFIKDFIHTTLGHPMKDALLICTLCMFLLMLLVPVTGWLSDRWGRKRMLMWTTVAYFVSVWPIFYLMTMPGFLPVLVAQILLTVVLACYIGPAPTVFVELFPTSVRFTGMAMSYNICASLFGGTAPNVSIWLIKETHMNTIVAFYIMLSAVISFVSFIGYHDRYKEELR